jgi:hypothetical protein
LLRKKSPEKKHFWESVLHTYQKQIGDQIAPLLPHNTKTIKADRFANIFTTRSFVKKYFLKAYKVTVCR